MKTLGCFLSRKCRCALNVFIKQKKERERQESGAGIVTEWIIGN